MKPWYIFQYQTDLTCVSRVYCQIWRRACGKQSSTTGPWTLARWRTSAPRSTSSSQLQESSHHRPAPTPNLRSSTRRRQVHPTTERCTQRPANTASTSAQVRGGRLARGKSKWIVFLFFAFIKIQEKKLCQIKVCRVGGSNPAPYYSTLMYLGKTLNPKLLPLFLYLQRGMQILALRRPVHMRLQRKCRLH